MAVNSKFLTKEGLGGYLIAILSSINNLYWGDLMKKMKEYLPSGNVLDRRLCRYCDFWDKVSHICILKEMKGMCRW